MFNALLGKSHEELQNFLLKKQNEMNLLQKLPAEFQRSILHDAHIKEAEAFDAFIKAIHHRKICEETILTEEPEESSRA